MRVYISGAITNTTDYPLRFASAEQKLELMGHEVINPVKVFCVLPTLKEVERRTLNDLLLCLCEEIYIMPHSENDRDVMSTIFNAELNGIPVHYL